jgi:uncharacterized protein (TIGR02996 family)
MGRLEEHEAFLRAIFDAPADDTPRLVYADFLEENGEPERAELIRVQCELETLRTAGTDPARIAVLEARSAELIGMLRPPSDTPWLDDVDLRRGFSVLRGAIVLPAEELSDPERLRAVAVRQFPEWYAETTLIIGPGRAVFPEEIPVLFGLPFTQQVTDWEFSGHVEELAADPGTEDAGTYGLIDMHERPVINTAGVEAMTLCRGVRRVRSLSLANNRLGNDAARAIIRCPYFTRLERLDLDPGNRFSGQMWQELRARFGEGVIG